MKNDLTQNRNKILSMVQFALLLAIEVIVCFTPLGSIPFTPMIVATLSHIPVIIAAIMLGTVPGAAMGFFFGLFSLIVMTWVSPGPASFVFTPFYQLGPYSGNAWSLVICFVPRILIGVVAGLSAKGFRRVFRGNKVLAYGLAGLLGSLTNTILVLTGIYVFFGPSYAEVYDMAHNLLLGAMAAVVLTNGVPEAILGAVTAYGICRPLEAVLKRTQNG